MLVDQVILNVNDTIKKILSALANQLTFKDNFRSVFASVSDSGTANTEFILTHKLGRVPEGFIITDLTVQSTIISSSKSLWTTTEMRLKCSAANVGFTILVF